MVWQDNKVTLSMYVLSVCTVQTSEPSYRYEQVLGIAGHHIPTRSKQLPTTNQQASLRQGRLPAQPVAERHSNHRLTNDYFSLS